MVPFLSLSDVVTTNGKLSVPVYGEDADNHISAEYVDEGDELTDNVGKFTTIDLSGYVIGALALISNKLKDNTDIDVVNFIVQRVAESIAEKLENEFINGSEKITGITAAQAKQTAAAASFVTYVFFLTDEDEITKGTAYFETVEVDYLVGPYNCSSEDAAEIALWVKARRANSFTVKAVLPNTAADSEGIINFTTEDIDTSEKKYTTAEYCARIAGIIAGTPMSISATYAPLSEVVNVKRMDREAMDEAVEKGEFIIWHDGEKVKTGRAVNSLVTTTAEKGEAYHKIKVVEAVDMIQRDIRRTCEDSYIGKYPNSYDNKCLLISSIKAYLETLERANILKSASSTVEIDIEAQRAHLESRGTDTSSMSEQEIKEAATGSVVYISGSITVLDAIEDVQITVVCLKGGSNLIDATVTESNKNLVNSVLVLDKNGNTLFNQTDTESVSLYGTMQKAVKQQDNTGTGSIISEILKEASPKQRITVTCLGNTNCVTGGVVMLIEPVTGLSGKFFIDSDTHTWKNGIYTNKLVLNFEAMADEKNAGSSTGITTASSNITAALEKLHAAAVR